MPLRRGVTGGRTSHWLRLPTHCWLSGFPQVSLLGWFMMPSRKIVTDEFWRTCTMRKGAAWRRRCCVEAWHFTRSEERRVGTEARSGWWGATYEEVVES